MKQSERNRTCPITQSYLNKGQQPPARKVRRHTSPDVLNQAFIYQNANDYRRKRISNQFDATPVARRGRVGSSDNVLNQAFLESRSTRGNTSKPSSDVLNTAMYRGTNINQSRKGTSSQYVGSQHVKRDNSYPSKYSGGRSYIEPRRLKENLRSSDIVNNQAYRYPRSNEYKATRMDNQTGRKPLSQRENLRSTGNYSAPTERDLRPTRRRVSEPTNARNIPNTYSNLNQLQRNGNSEQWNRRPSTARGHAPLLTEQRTKSLTSTPSQAPSFRVRCTPQVSALSTSHKVASAGHQSVPACSRSFHEMLLRHLARPSSTSQTFSPKMASPDRKKTPRMMSYKSDSQCSQRSGQKTTSPTADGSIQSSQDAEDDCFGDFKQLFPELHVELPKDFWTDPSKKLLLRRFLEDSNQEECLDNLPETPNVGKNDQEQTKRKASFIKHVRNDLKEKIPQLQLVVKMLELVMSWKKMKRRRNKKGSKSDESATSKGGSALNKKGHHSNESTNSKRGSAVGRTGETPLWCYCDKEKPNQRPSHKVIKQEVSTPATVKIENIALKPEPL